MGGVAIAPTQTSARLLARAAADEGHPADPARFVTADAAAAIRSQPVARLQPIEMLPPALSVRDRARPYETFERWGIGRWARWRRCRRPICRRGWAAAARRCSGWRAGSIRARSCPTRPRRAFSSRLELEWPIDELEPLSFVFARLLDPLSTALERADRGAAALRLDLRLVDRSTHARVLQLPVAHARRAGAAHVDAARSRIASASPPRPIDIVAIEVDPAPARITQFSLLERALPSAEALSTLDGAIVGAGRRDTLRHGRPRGQSSAGRVRDAALCERR